MKKRFHAWYADEVKKQLKEVPLDQVKVDLTAAFIKNRCANWIISSWQALQQRPEAQLTEVLTVYQATS